jgi:hypothetical protein
LETAATSDLSWLFGRFRCRPSARVLTERRRRFRYWRGYVWGPMAQLTYW